jgi:DNA-binding ferritin-like protein
MKNLAVLFRASQLIVHRFHNITKGPSFFSDHEFFGDLYPLYEKAYDQIVERMMGLDQKPDLNTITSEACKTAVAFTDSSADAMFRQLLKIEKTIQENLTKEIPKATQGTANLLAQLADESEARLYQVKQRLA